MATPEPRQDATALPSEPPTATRALALGHGIRGADEAANPARETQAGAFEETTSQDPGGEESAPDLTSYRQRWRVWAALGVLGAALGFIAVPWFWRAGSQSVAAPSRPTNAVPAAQKLEATKLPPAANPARDAERAPTQDQPAVAEADAEPRAGASDEEGSASGSLTSIPPSRRASALVSRGHDLRKRRQYAQAKARYEQALALLPGYPRALAGLAQLSIAQNRGKEAVQFAQRLTSARPGQATYQLLLGDAYKAANMPKEAQQAWQTAARRGNSLAKARLQSSTQLVASVAPAKNGSAAAKRTTSATPASLR
jgi:tetratricopeptide (TPR) repeat protein